MKGFKKVSQAKFDHFIVNYPTRLTISNLTTSTPPWKVYQDAKRNWIGYVEVYKDKPYIYFLKMIDLIRNNMDYKP